MIERKARQGSGRGIAALALELLRAPFALRVIAQPDTPSAMSSFPPFNTNCTEHQHTSYLETPRPSIIKAVISTILSLTRAFLKQSELGTSALSRPRLCQTRRKESRAISLGLVIWHYK